MKYVVAAGGTGGHIYPALYFAKYLINCGHEVLFVAGNKKIDHQILDDSGLELVHYKFSGFLRERSLSGICKNVVNAGRVFINFGSVYGLLKKYRPDVVIGFGGYVTLPLCYVSNKIGIFTAIHEQNSYPGVVNRRLSQVVDRTFYTYEGCLDYFDTDNAVFSNNPRIDYVKSVLSSCEISCQKRSVLFVGGSLGADKINDLAVLFALENPDFMVTLVAGVRNYDKFNGLSFDNLRVCEYLDDPIISFCEHELVVSRGGATTLVELDALSKATIIIPSPNVVADHQYINAVEMEKKGNFRVVLEEDVSVKAILFQRLALDLNAVPKKFDSSVELISKEIDAAVN